MQWSDRLSVEELAPQTVSRPSLAVSRRLPGVDAVVDPAPVAKQSGVTLPIGARGGVSVADGKQRTAVGLDCCRLLPLLGGKNVSVSVAPVRNGGWRHEGAQRTRSKERTEGGGVACGAASEYVGNKGRRHCRGPRSPCGL